MLRVCRKNIGKYGTDHGLITNFQRFISIMVFMLNSRKINFTIFQFSTLKIFLCRLFSMFYGILLLMYVFDSDRHHLPHIHVRYHEFKASIAIPNGDVLDGNLPVRQMKLIQA